MEDAVGSLIRRAAGAACLCVIAAVPVLAQTPVPSPVEPPPAPEFLTHSKFYLSAAALQIDDPRFTWDTHFGGILDVVDYRVGRINGVADYEAILGNEFRLFDPNQGNYTLEASASVRAGRTEIAGVFHHVSRHLSDRFKREAIAWNVAGARILRRLNAGTTTVDMVAGAGAVTERAYVDYSWTADADVVVRHPITPRVGVYGHGTGNWFGVTSDSTRDGQAGGRIEVGFRFNGASAAAELFGGFERRNDADPLDQQPQRWIFGGFRLVNR